MGNFLSRQSNKIIFLVLISKMKTSKKRHLHHSKNRRYSKKRRYSKNKNKRYSGVGKRRPLIKNYLYAKNKYRYPDGALYDGDWWLNQRSGNGKQIEPDGTVYEGEWLEDKKNGRGKETKPDGTVYEGVWFEDKKSYLGKETKRNGTMYEGHWFQDKKDGIGKETKPDGTVYEGEWLYDKKSYLGKETKRNGTMYEGHWFQDKKDGIGKETKPDGTVYEGEWLYDKKNRKGTETKPDGTVYEGEWLDDKKNGRGKETKPDGTVYEGEWLQDKKNGRGKETKPDGTVYEGAWVLDTFRDQDKVDIMNRFHLNKAELSYTQKDIMPTSINESDYTYKKFLFARLISYVKTLSELTGIPMNGDILEVYFDLYKNKPISDTSREKLSKIVEHITCEQKTQQIYHFYMSRDGHLSLDEHQPILRNNNPTINYNVVFIKQTASGYEPIHINCQYDKDIVFVVSSRGYSTEEFDVLTQVMKDLDKTTPSETILLHDTDYYVLNAHDFPHIRKVVNCYNTDVVSGITSEYRKCKDEHDKAWQEYQDKKEPFIEQERRLRQEFQDKNGHDPEDQFIKSMTVENYKLMSQYNEQLKQLQEGYNNEHALWRIAYDKFKQAEKMLDNHPLYRLIKTDHLLKDRYDVRIIIDGVSIYPYHYVQKQREESHLVTDTWWYRYFNRTMSCARGRVLQFRGTCWFNTILNTMLLTPPLKSYLKAKLSTYSESYAPYIKDGIFSYTVPESIVLLGMEASYDDVEPHYLHLRRTLAPNLFSEPFKAFFYARLNSSLYLDDKCLLHLSKLLNPTTIDAGKSRFIRYLFDILSIEYDYFEIENKSLHDFDEDFVPSIIEFLNNSTKQFALISRLIYCGKYSIPLHTNNYHLESAGLASINHSIIGLHCNSIPYIYDSNNIIAPSNWPEMDFSGYFEKVMDVKNSPIRETNYINKCQFLLYCKK